MTAAPLSLRRNFVWTFAGNVVYAVSLWALLAVLTKLGSPEVVGRYMLASTIATPGVVFAQLQLRSVLVTDADNTYVFQDYLAVRLASLPLALLVIAAVAIAGYGAAQVVAIMLFAAGRTVESVSDILYGYAQRCERLDLVAVSKMIKGVVSLALFGLVFAATRDLTLGLTALVAAWLLPLLLFDLPVSRRLIADDPVHSLRPRWNWRLMGRIAWLALPMGGVMLLFQLRNTIPRAGLEAWHGEEALGLFGPLSYFIVAGTTVTTALAQASIARLGRYRAEGRLDRFRRTVGRLVLLGVGLGLAGVAVAAVAGAPLLRFLYAEAYARESRLLVVVMAGGGLLYVTSLMGAPAAALRMFREMLWVHLFGAAATAAAAWLLIPSGGAAGAAWPIVVGGAATAVGSAFIVWSGVRRLERAPGGAAGAEPT